MAKKKKVKSVASLAESTEIDGQGLINDVISQENNILHGVVDSIDDYLFVIDSMGSIHRVNKKVYDLIGNDRVKVMGHMIDHFVRLEKDYTGYDKEVFSRLNGERGVILGPNNKKIPVILTTAPYCDENGTHGGFVICARDMEKEIQLQVKLLELEKWKSMGKMASGVAHEINNPLAIIYAHCESMIDLLEDKEINRGELKFNLESVILTVQRAARIIEALKNLSRDNSNNELTERNLGDIFEESLALCRRRFNQHAIKLDVDLSSPSAPLMCQGTQISQVILNLLNNSFDAVKEQKNPWIRLIGRESQGMIVVTVEDSGDWIDDTVANKVFEPFFTTKGPQDGTGIGLSISKTIIELHKGEVFLDRSKPHTSFVVQLPLAEGAIKRSAS